jgi:hypothetical protein
MQNDCESKFDGDVSVSCLLELVSDARKGFSLELLKKATWILGCILAKLPEASLFDRHIGDASLLEVKGDDSDEDFEALLFAIECKCEEFESKSSSIQSGGPPVGNQGWEVFIPLILAFIQAMLENRKKKQQPAPQPGT